MDHNKTVRKRQIQTVQKLRLLPEDRKNHYTISFMAPKEIGLKLALTSTSQLIVQGFNKLSNGSMAPAEACGAIKIGDILTQVDDIDFYDLGPIRFAAAMEKYEHSKTKLVKLTFQYADDDVCLPTGRRGTSLGGSKITESQSYGKTRKEFLSPGIASGSFDGFGDDSYDQTFGSDEYQAHLDSCIPVSELVAADIRRKHLYETAAVTSCFRHSTNYEATIREIGLACWEWHAYYSAARLAGFFKVSSVFEYRYPNGVSTPLSRAIYQQTPLFEWDDEYQDFIPLDMKYPRLVLPKLRKYREIVELFLSTLPSIPVYTNWAISLGKRTVRNENSAQGECYNSDKDDNTNAHDDEDNDFDITKIVPALTFVWQTTSTRDHEFEFTSTAPSSLMAATSDPLFDSVSVFWMNNGVDKTPPKASNGRYSVKSYDSFDKVARRLSRDDLDNFVVLLDEHTADSGRSGGREDTKDDEIDYFDNENNSENYSEVDEEEEAVDVAKDIEGDDNAWHVADSTSSISKSELQQSLQRRKSTPGQYLQEGAFVDAFLKLTIPLPSNSSNLDLHDNQSSNPSAVIDKSVTAPSLHQFQQHLKSTPEPQVEHLSVDDNYTALVDLLTSQITAKSPVIIDSHVLPPPPSYTLDLGSEGTEFMAPTGHTPAELLPYLPSRIATHEVIHLVRTYTHDNLDLQRIRDILGVWIRTFQPLPNAHHQLLNKVSYGQKYASSHGFPSSEEMSRFMMHTTDLVTLFAICHICAPFLSLTSDDDLIRHFQAINSTGTPQNFESFTNLSSLPLENFVKAVRAKLCRFSKLSVFISAFKINYYCPSTDCNSVGFSSSNISCQWDEKSTSTFFHIYSCYLHLDIIAAACSAMDFKTTLQSVLDFADTDPECQQANDIFNQLFSDVSSYAMTALPTSANSASHASFSRTSDSTGNEVQQSPISPALLHSNNRRNIASLTGLSLEFVLTKIVEVTTPKFNKWLCLFITRLNSSFITHTTLCVDILAWCFPYIRPHTVRNLLMSTISSYNSISSQPKKINLHEPITYLFSPNLSLSEKITQHCGILKESTLSFISSLVADLNLTHIQADINLCPGLSSNSTKQLLEKLLASGSTIVGTITTSSEDFSHSAAPNDKPVHNAMDIYFKYLQRILNSNVISLTNSSSTSLIDTYQLGCPIDSSTSLEYLYTLLYFLHAAEIACNNANSVDPTRRPLKTSRLRESTHSIISSDCNSNNTSKRAPFRGLSSHEPRPTHYINQSVLGAILDDELAVSQYLRSLQFMLSDLLLRSDFFSIPRFQSVVLMLMFGRYTDALNFLMQLNELKSATTQSVESLQQLSVLLIILDRLFYQFKLQLPYFYNLAVSQIKTPTDNKNTSLSRRLVRALLPSAELNVAPIAPANASKDFQELPNKFQLPSSKSFRNISLEPDDQTSKSHSTTRGEEIGSTLIALCNACCLLSKTLQILEGDKEIVFEWSNTFSSLTYAELCFQLYTRSVPATDSATKLKAIVEPANKQCDADAFIGSAAKTSLPTSQTLGSSLKLVSDSIVSKDHGVWNHNEPQESIFYESFQATFFDICARVTSLWNSP